MDTMLLRFRGWNFMKYFKVTLLATLLCFSTAAYSLDRDGAHQYVDNVADTYTSITQRIKRRLLRIWYWNTVRPEDYQELKKFLKEKKEEELELEEIRELSRASIKSVPNNVYVYLETCIALIKAKRELRRAEKKVHAYEQTR